MAESRAFEVACGELERATSLSGLESRGTIRLALKASGLDANVVTAAEMTVIVEKVLPEELTLRGVKEAEAATQAIAMALQAADFADENRPDSPEAVFSRLGG